MGNLKKTRYGDTTHNQYLLRTIKRKYVSYVLMSKENQYLLRTIKRYSKLKTENSLLITHNYANK